MSVKKNVPQLRFGEFDGVWEKKKLGDIGTTNSGLTYSPNDVVESEGTLVLRSSNIQNDMISFLSNVYVDCQIKEKEKLREKDILFCARNGSKKLIGKNILVKKKEDGLVFGAFMGVYRSPYNDFISHFFKSHKFYKQVHQHLGATINQITSKSLNSFKIFLPSSDKEREKIANFLASVESKIEQLTKKEALLQKYKKGVMQKIFSQEIRFQDDDGSDFPEWKKKKLGDTLDYLQPTKYLVESTKYNNSYKTPVLTAGKTFILGYTNEVEGIFTDRLPTIIFDDFTTATKFVDFPFKAKSSAMKMLVVKNGFNIKFIYEAMQMIKYDIGGHERHWISKYSQINIKLPSLEEQIKIASFLSAIDGKIEQTKKQIDKTKKFKRALLQQMFV